MGGSSCPSALFGQLTQTVHNTQHGRVNKRSCLCRHCRLKCPGSSTFDSICCLPAVALATRATGKTRAAASRCIKMHQAQASACIVSQALCLSFFGGVGVFLRVWPTSGPRGPHFCRLCTAELKLSTQSAHLPAPQKVLLGQCVVNSDSLSRSGQGQKSALACHAPGKA